MLTFLAIFSYLLSFAILIALSVNDVRDYILPNKLNAALALSLAAFHIFTKWQLLLPQEAFWGMIVGGSFLLIIRWGASSFYNDDAVGLGDVKLMAAGGIGLGFPNILLAMSIGACIGILHGVWLAHREAAVSGGKPELAKTNVPAGLGLAVGIAIVLVSQFGFALLRM